MRRRTLFFGAGGSGGGGTPSAPDRSIQFNNAGAFGGSALAEILSNGTVKLTARTDADVSLNVNSNSATQTSPIVDVVNGSSAVAQGLNTIRGAGTGLTIAGSPALLQIDAEDDTPWQIVLTSVADGSAGAAGAALSYSDKEMDLLVTDGTGLNIGGFEFDVDGAGSSSFIRWQDNSTLVMGLGATVGLQLLDNAGAKLGFLGTAPIAKPTVAGAKLPGDVVMASLLLALKNYGLITDTTT